MSTDIIHNLRDFTRDELAIWSAAVRESPPEVRASWVLMKVRVLKVDRMSADIDELAEGIAVGRTIGGWEMPSHARPGDVAVWYATGPDQCYVAWGWVCGRPEPGFRGSTRRYVGPVAALRPIEPVLRTEAGRTSGFNKDPESVIAQPQTVPDHMAAAFLRALGLDHQLLEIISAEVAAVLAT